MAETKLSVLKKWGKLVLKIAITTLALYLVLSKITLSEVVAVISGARFFYLLLALLTYFVSKYIAGIRYHLLVKELGIHIHFKELIKLYWLGMFYNLSLPGGIGGDGYKAHMIHSSFKNGYKQNIGTLLYDRIVGLVVVLIIAVSLAIPLEIIQPFRWLFIAAVPLGIVAYFILAKYIFPSYRKQHGMALLLSFGVQLSQLLGVYFILRAIHNDAHFIEYFVLFFCSSIAAALPFTVGGIGARELVFLWGSEGLQIDSQVAVTVSLVFYLTTLICSLWGMVYLVVPPKINAMTESAVDLAE